MEIKTRLASNQDRLEAKAKERKEKKASVDKETKVKTLKAMADNKDLQNKFASKVAEKTSVGIEGQLVFADFLNMGTIDVGEPLIYTLDEPVERANIMEMSMQGGTPRETVVQNADYVRVNPYLVSSPEVSMSKFSLRQGDISAEEKALKRIEKAVARTMDTDAKSLLEAGVVNDFEAVDGINIDDNVTEFPLSNSKDMSSEGAITLNVLKAIARHYNLIGKRIRNVYVPATRLTDLWDFMSLPAGYDDGSGVKADNVLPQAMHEQVIRTGTLKNIFGYDMNLIPVNTLNGDAGNGAVNIWVSTYESAGEYREIPQFTDTFNHEDAKRMYFTLNKAIAMFQTPNQKLNYLKVQIG